jgi:hypothetical protein
VQMIGENHNCLNRERAFAAGHAKSIAKRIDVAHKRIRASVCKCGGKKIAAARKNVSSIPDHRPALRMGLNAPVRLYVSLRSSLN